QDQRTAVGHGDGPFGTRVVTADVERCHVEFHVRERVVAPVELGEQFVTGRRGERRRPRAYVVRVELLEFGAVTRQARTQGTYEYVGTIGVRRHVASLGPSSFVFAATNSSSVSVPSSRSFASSFSCAIGSVCAGAGAADRLVASNCRCICRLYSDC